MLKKNTARNGVVTPDKDGRCGRCGFAHFVWDGRGVRGYRCVNCGGIKPETWRTDLLAARHAGHIVPNKLDEALLTVLALSQESYRGPVKAVVPRRLVATLRAARRQGLVEMDSCGVYLEEPGAAYVDERFGAAPFCHPHARKDT